MEAAYVDTSCLVAVAFDEPRGAEVGRKLEGVSELLSSHLLEAELRSAFVREAVTVAESLLASVTWVLPDRPLGAEIERVLHAGYARGADAWHLATALYLVEDPRDLPFFTLDDWQRQLAGALGFPTPV